MLFNYTDEGCKKAKKYLDKNGINYYNCKNGYEIVKKANKHVKTKSSSE